MQFINNIFGAILNFIFEGVALISPIAALGITIILFTLVTRALLTPFQLSSQRTSRAMGKIQPELKRIQDKYKDKKDQASQLKYSQEMQSLYKKYKINPLAGCLPLLIQFPLIIALFNVLREPARYITRLANEYTQIASSIMSVLPNGAYEKFIDPEVLKNVELTTRQTFDLANTEQFGQFLSHLSTHQWDQFLSKMGDATRTLIEPAMQLKERYETFLGVSVVDTPQMLVSNGLWLAIIVPIIAGASTYIFSKITMAANASMQQSASGAKNGQPDTAQSMMKTMNIMMPIMTGFFSWTMPIGLALYWIAGNVIMMGQQFVVNKYLEKKDAELDAQLRKEQEEAIKNNKTQKKKVMKKVPVQKTEEPIKQETEGIKTIVAADGTKTYKKTVVKRVPIQKSESQEEVTTQNTSNKE